MKFIKKIIALPENTIGFIKNVFKEIRLVEFPSRKDTLKMTNNVIIISIITALFILALDTIFIQLRTYLTTI